MTTEDQKKVQFSTAGWILFIFFLVCIIVFVAWNVINRGLFEYIGIDYRLWYSSAMIARDHGFSSIYNINLQTQYQYPLYQQYSHLTTVSMPFWPLPLPYFSFFILPMLLFTLVTPILGFSIWSFINIIGTVTYLYFFMRRNKYVISWQIIILVLIALPVVLNIIFGQINLWLLIAFGESIIALRRKHDFVSGLWLAGLLLKPQTLILLIPGLLIAKKFKVLSGFFSGAMLIGLLSLSISGTVAFTGPYQTIISWPTQLGESGMSLFALMANLNKGIPISISWSVIILVTLLTIIVIIWLWLPKQSPLSDENLEMTFFASFAAACIISPHSNVHMAIPLLAPGLAMLSKKQISARLCAGWVFLPSILFLLISLGSIGAAHIVGGMILLLANMIILYWLVIKRIRNSKALPE